MTEGTEGDRQGKDVPRNGMHGPHSSLEEDAGGGVRTLLTNSISKLKSQKKKPQEGRGGVGETWIEQNLLARKKRNRGSESSVSNFLLAARLMRKWRRGLERADKVGGEQFQEIKLAGSDLQLGWGGGQRVYRERDAGKSRDSTMR